MIELSWRPVLAILVSLLAAGGTMLVGDKRPNLRDSLSVIAAILMFALIASMVPAFWNGGVVESEMVSLAPGVSLHLRVDALGLVFALVSTTLWVATSIYNIGYMRAAGEKNQTGYYAAFAVCVSSAVGIALAANLLTFLFFFEILTIATYPLVIHKRTPEALAAGRKYLIFTLVAGQALLLATIWCMVIVPGAEFTAGGFLRQALLTDKISLGGLRLLFALFIVGVAVKAAVMPLHPWLPAAMVAPTPVSALLHAVAVVKAGVFGVLRIVEFVFGHDLVAEIGVGKVLAAAAGITIITASVIALGQSNLKKRLAYSTVSQLSYIVLGAALANPIAIAGAVMHIVTHAFMKITLFFCAGSIYAHAHKTEIPELDGLGRKMPLTFAAFTIGSASLAGVPLFAGFVSKWQLGLGAARAHQWIYIAVLMTSALLNIAYFAPIVIRAYWGGEKGAKLQWKDAPWMLLGPPVFAAAVVILLGVWPNFGVRFYELAQTAAGIGGSALAAGGTP